MREKLVNIKEKKEKNNNKNKETSYDPFVFSVLFFLLFLFFSIYVDLPFFPLNRDSMGAPLSSLFLSTFISFFLAHRKLKSQ